MDKAVWCAKVNVIAKRQIEGQHTHINALNEDLEENTSLLVWLPTSQEGGKLGPILRQWRI